MKFTKTVAEALANKTVRNLRQIREQQIKEFKPSKEQEKELKELVRTLMGTRFALIQAERSLKEFVGTSVSYYSNDSEEKIFANHIDALAASNAIKVPSYTELIDDFLIESIDAVSAEDLIEKVTAKYIK